MNGLRQSTIFVDSEIKIVRTDIMLEGDIQSSNWLVLCVKTGDRLGSYFTEPKDLIRSKKLDQIL